MDTELKSKWVEALRSGKYLQCRSVLRSNLNGDEVGYCCLGVLLDLQGAEWVASEAINDAYRARIGDEDLAPNSGAEKFAAAFPYFTGQVALDLMNKNDSAGSEAQHTFSEIADYIEREL